MESEFGSQGNPQSDSAFNGRALVEDAPAYDFASLGVSYRPAIGAAQLGANDGVYRVHAVDLAAWHAVEMVEKWSQVAPLGKDWPPTSEGRGHPPPGGS